MTQSDTPALPDSGTPGPGLPELRAEDFDFALPDGLIAQAPARPRDSARLLVVGGDGTRDLGVADLPGLLGPGDLMVVNDTRVIPARLHARRGEARVEIMLNRADSGGQWHALVRGAKKLRPGDVLTIEGAPELAPRVVERQDGGAVLLDFGPDQALLASALEKAGEVPLPPYIARPDGPTDQDREDYTHLFARQPGAVAAPTASLHFTPALVQALAARGVAQAEVTLHVGAGTFLPIRTDNPRAHKLHAEWGEITPEAAAAINAARARGGRIVAIGTTALRLLESAVDENGTIHPFQGLTDIFLLPGHRFRSADVLLTNFHLPKSSLFMLVSAFSGTERMRQAYAHAVRAGYRFYSYGDASLLFRENAK
jgi:S-adenosylmethionine:tRNA ribosyltransferase-isomerase